MNRLDYTSVQWSEYFELLNETPYIKRKDNKILNIDFSSGYGRIRFRGKRWLIHRIRSTMGGILSDNSRLVDHIDGDTMNNHPNNLRECAATDNAKNVKSSGRNLSGKCGVYKQVAKQNYFYFVVQWSENVKRKRKLFRYNKDNELEKFEEACKFRDKIEIINGYSKRHGKG